MTSADGAATSPPEAGAASLTRGRLLARNTLWSLLGQVLPMIAAVLAIPQLVRGLGTESFGVLTIAWTVLGYFALLDLGLGRSLTQMVAERLGSGRTADLPALIWTSLILLSALSLVGALAMFVATPFLVRDVLHVPAALEHQTVATFHLLALSLPALLLTAGLGGVLAAHQKFGTLNLLRVPLGVLAYLGPLAILPFSRDLSHAVAVIVLVRYAGVLGHLWACLGIGSGLRLRPKWNARLAGPLLKSGGWIALINGIVPLFVTFDRFLVGAWLSLAAVAYYATPQEIAIKMWGIPGPLVAVLFPAFAASHQVDAGRLRLLFRRGLKFVFCALFPVTVVLVVLSGELLRFWLGPAFEQNGRMALQILVVGAFFTGLAYVPSALVQAVGRPRDVALLFLVELPLYLIVLAWGVRAWGVPGAALAWTGRALVELIGLMVLARPFLRDRPPFWRRLTRPLAITLAALGGAFAVQPLGLWPRVAFLVIVLGSFLTWAWVRGFADERRAWAWGSRTDP